MSNRYSKLLLGSIVVLLAGHPVARAADRPTPIAVQTREPTVRLYGSSDGAQIGSRDRSSFPKEIVVLERADTGRVKVRFPDGQVAWLRGRDVQVGGGERPKLECDPVTNPKSSTIAAVQTRGGRGASGAGCQ